MSQHFRTFLQTFLKNIILTTSSLTNDRRQLLDSFQVNLVIRQGSALKPSFLGAS